MLRMPRLPSGSLSCLTCVRFWGCCSPHVHPPAELMGVLRVAVETRKTQLVDAALDCIQKLISHSILTGPVHSINHKREAAGKVASGRRRPTEDLDDDLGSVSGVMPPQVSCSLHAVPGQRVWCDPAAAEVSAFCLARAVCPS